MFTSVRVTVVLNPPPPPPTNYTITTDLQMRHHLCWCISCNHMLIKRISVTVRQPFIVLVNERLPDYRSPWSPQTPRYGVWKHKHRHWWGNNLRVTSPSPGRYLPPYVSVKLYHSHMLAIMHTTPAMAVTRITPAIANKTTKTSMFVAPIWNESLRGCESKEIDI